MRIVGCGLHARQQTIAMVDTDTGEFVEKTLPPRRECGTRVLRGLTSSSGGRNRSHRMTLSGGFVLPQLELERAFLR